MTLKVSTATETLKAVARFSYIATPGLSCLNYFNGTLCEQFAIKLSFNISPYSNS